MKQSALFSRTFRDAPRDEEAVNAKLLTRGGFVEKLMAGVYTYLPLGKRVLEKISNVVREEMNAVGGQEILMPILHPKSIWVRSGGWDKIDVLFKIKSRTEKEYALGQSEEEVVVPLVGRRIAAVSDLPVSVYQINWKFRDELRAKSGILRGREFLMKDMYSFHADQADFERYYAVVKKSYLKIFKRFGLVAKVTEASGGSFTEKISYEYMVLTEAGEDKILHCDACEFCVNMEISKKTAGQDCPKCTRGKLHAARASEVGNVFDLGQKYTRDFAITVSDGRGNKIHPTMGCYGIGISRLLGVIVEKFHDERGIIWPEAAAPFSVHLLELKAGLGKKLYDDLQRRGIEVLYDERNATAGEKFADADLMGIPMRLVVSERTGAKIELKKRSQSTAKLVTASQIAKLVS